MAVSGAVTCSKSSLYNNSTQFPGVNPRLARPFLPAYLHRCAVSLGVFKPSTAARGYFMIRRTLATLIAAASVSLTGPAANAAGFIVVDNVGGIAPTIAMM